MRYLSVCSGIEAATVAWHPLGWQPAAFSEIEDFPSAVLAHHYPAVPNLGDMEKHRDWRLSDVDLLVGGTPCQSFSVAGLRKGMADPRGNLALVYLAIAERLRPSWLVWENVPGVLSSSGGRDFGAFLGGLVELGYGFAYRVLDAQYFGVPQRRRRVFVVGHSGGWQRAAAVLFERASLRGDSAPSREARERTAPTLAARAKAGGGLGTDHDLDGGLQVTHSLSAEGCDASEDGTGRGTPLVANPLTARMHKGVNTTMDEGVTLVAAPMTTKPYADNEAQESRLVIAAPLTAGGTRGANAPGRRKEDDENLVTTLAIRGRGDSHDLETRQDGTANAILTPNGGRSGIGVGAIADKSNVRRLTPRECERLQGFPDGYTAIPVKRVGRNRLRSPKRTSDGYQRYTEIGGEAWQIASDTPRYRALGNSMAVPVMRWIGERIRQQMGAGTNHG